MTVSSPTPAKQLAGFIAKFDPAIAKLTRACRAELRKQLPSAVELVYDNYQALAIGFGSTERQSDCIVSLAVFPTKIALSFYHGVAVPDPKHVLLGDGKQNRFVRLDTVDVLRTADVRALIQAAAAIGETPLRRDTKGQTVIKSISAKQRSRRPTGR